MSAIGDKVRKLLALARDKGASENEASNALAMAQRLMMQHNLTESDIVSNEEIIAIRGDWMNINRGDKWEIMLSAAVSQLFNCRAVHNSLGNHQFVGKMANVEACEMTFVWVCEQVDGLYKQGLATFRLRMGSLTKADRADFRRTFKESCALRVWHRACEIVAAARNEIPAHKALVIIDQSLAAADDLLRDVKKGRSLSVKRSGFGTGAGIAAGNQVKLQGEVSSGKCDHASQPNGD